MTPEEAKAQRLRDEAFSMITEHYPAHWRGLYLKCLEEGFDKFEALSLVKVYILMGAPYGVHVHKD